jgi:hypothetical protein
VVANIYIYITILAATPEKLPAKWVAKVEANLALALHNLFAYCQGDLAHPTGSKYTFLCLATENSAELSERCKVMVAFSCGL